jgi:hypothetical protein
MYKQGQLARKPKVPGVAKGRWKGKYKHQQMQTGVMWRKRAQSPRRMVSAGNRTQE